MRFLQWLNQYSNLLLALLTLAYVFLTYRMLRALRRESTREHRLRHLEDIKSKVVRPIREWITSHAVPMLQGEFPAVFPGLIRVERADAKIGEVPFEEKIELLLQSTKFDKGGYLFEHAKTVHFPDQLKAVEKFVADFESLLDDYLDQAKRWADATAHATTLPRVNGSRGFPGEFVDSDCVAASYLRSLVAARMPDMKLTHPAPDVTEVKEPGSGRLIARGESAEIRSWLEASRRIVNDGWKENDFAERTKDTLFTALVVREFIGRIDLTYDLGGDCEYVGGQGAWNLSKLLGSFVRKWRRGAGVDP